MITNVPQMEVSDDAGSSTQELPLSFALSKAIEDLGHTLTPAQANVVDVAQTLNRKFMRGAAVSLIAIERVAMAYHQHSRSDIRDAVLDLYIASIVEHTTGPNDRMELRLLLRFRGGRLVVKGEPWRSPSAEADAVNPFGTLLKIWTED